MFPAEFRDLIKIAIIILLHSDYVSLPVSLYKVRFIYGQSRDNCLAAGRRFFPLFSNCWSRL